MARSHYRYRSKELGKRFGKWDLDRVGYFDDPSSAPFDEYQPAPVEFREGIDKGRQIFAGPPTDLFEEKFVRILTGEALHEPWRIEAAERLQRGQTNIGGRMLPTSPAKKHSTPGDWHGCFEKVTYFSPGVRDTKRGLKPELPNAKTRPNPRGGPGYVDICLNPYPPYSHEPYDPVQIPAHRKKRDGRFLTASAPMDFFPPNPYKEIVPGPTYVRPTEVSPKIVGPDRFYVPFPKKPGGNHSGCFDKFPSYASNPYDMHKERKTVEGVFVSGGPPLRTKYTNSIIDHVTRIACNGTNYIHYREQVYPLKR